jgi:hypothetical protein
MKTTLQNLLAAMLVAVSLQTHAQGTLIYDQQSATNPYSIHAPFTDGLYIQEDSPLLQSFIPAFSTVGFVQLEFEDVPSNGTNGATVYVNLWTGSTRTNTATFLGSTTPVYMPDGFINGPYYTGVTNFYFPTPITLTLGQTYYLQPVVLSGDDPWAVMTIGDTYPNGQLYGSTGGAFQPSTDLWFREGVVPEPTTLVLFGLSGILIFAFKRRSKLFVLFGVGVLFLGSARAQLLSVQSTPDSIVQIAADEAGLPTVSASALPRTGTFWVVTPGRNDSLMALPYPCLPTNLSALPIYSVTANTFLVDASGSDALVAGNAGSTMRRRAAATTASTLMMQADTVASLIEQIQTSGINPLDVGGDTNGGFQFNGFTSSFDTNGMWL